MKKDELKIGNQFDQMSDSETVAILKAKNGTHTMTGATPYEIGLEYSYTGGIAKSLWGNKNVDWILIRDRIKTFFVNLFQWKGMDPEFRREFELILFRHGKCAVIKTPNGDIYPTQFDHDQEDEDFYGNPKKITIRTTNDMNGTVYNEDEFVLVYNNTTRVGTLDYSNERLRQTVRALRDVDNAGIISRPKWGVNSTQDDQAMVDAENAMNSDKWLIPLGNINFQDMDIKELSGTDMTDSKMNIYMFQLSNMLKLLGLQANIGNIKAERQTELEISRNDEFNNLLIMDMYERRMDKIDELKELGLEVSLEVDETIQDENKDEVNGELNKIKEGITGDDHE